MQFFSNTSKRVTIFGGSGFIGRYIVRRLAALGWKIKIVTRNSDKSLFLRTYGEIGQVEIIKANLSDMDQFYIETPTLGGFFLKVGMDRGRIQTSETLGTGSAYGDKDLDGQTFGFGFRGTSDSGIHMKIIAEQTEFDDLEFKSTADAEGNQNTINTSDFNTYGLKFSIGYNF